MLGTWAYYLSSEWGPRAIKHSDMGIVTRWLRLEATEILED